MLTCMLARLTTLILFWLSGTQEERAAVLLTFMPTRLSTLILIWLSGTLGRACSCTAHVHCDTFKKGISTEEERLQLSHFDWAERLAQVGAT